jgi:hypothetical protein
LRPRDGELRLAASLAANWIAFLRSIRLVDGALIVPGGFA